jgi:hypothetical protein
MKDGRIDLNDVTRLTIVGPDGRVSEDWDIAVDVFVQDAGRTLKVFYRNRGK